MASADRYYEIPLTMSLEGLSEVPQGRTPQQVAYELIINIVVLWGKQLGGGTLAEHKLLRGIRKAFEEALKTKDDSVRISEEEFLFLNKCRHEGRTDFLANEAIFRVNELIDQADAEFKKKYGGG